jgi:hypothetical protein
MACLAGMLAGLLMLLGGLAWSQWASPRTVWSPEQATEHQAAGEALHAARRSAAPAGGESGAAESPELVAAQARFDAIDAKLAEAQTSRQRTGGRLVRLGLAAMVISGIGYLALRGEQ